MDQGRQLRAVSPRAVSALRWEPQARAGARGRGFIPLTYLSSGFPLASFFALQRRRMVSKARSFKKRNG